MPRNAWHAIVLLFCFARNVRGTPVAHSACNFWEQASPAHNNTCVCSRGYTVNNRLQDGALFAMNTSLPLQQAYSFENERVLSRVKNNTMEILTMMNFAPGELHDELVLLEFRHEWQWMEQPVWKLNFVLSLWQGSHIRYNLSSTKTGNLYERSETELIYAEKKYEVPIQTLSPGTDILMQIKLEFGKKIELMVNDAMYETELEDLNAYEPPEIHLFRDLDMNFDMNREYDHQVLGFAPSHVLSIRGNVTDDDAGVGLEPYMPNTKQDLQFFPAQVFRLQLGFTIALKMKLLTVDSDGKLIRVKDNDFDSEILVLASEFPTHHHQPAFKSTGHNDALVLWQDGYMGRLIFDVFQGRNRVCRVSLQSDNSAELQDVWIDIVIVYDPTSADLTMSVTGNSPETTQCSQFRSFQAVDLHLGGYTEQSNYGNTDHAVLYMFDKPLSYDTASSILSSIEILEDGRVLHPISPATGLLFAPSVVSSNIFRGLYMYQEHFLNSEQANLVFSTMQGLPGSAVPRVVCDNKEVMRVDAAFVDCSAGYYTDFQNNSAFLCQPCPAGTFAASIGRGSRANRCTPCLIGTYTNQTASSTCRSCAPNASALVSRSKLCRCNPGYTGVDGFHCQACAAGTYKIFHGSEACLACDGGFASAVVAATSASTCKPCPNGTFAEPGFAECRACAPGSYNEEKNASACLPCRGGFFSNASGASHAETCKICTNGTYSNGTGATSCVLCGEGKYSALAGETYEAACQDCSLGSYTIAPGSYQCTKCAPGKKSTVERANSSAVCQNCIAGKFQNRAGQSICVQCDLGYFGQGIGQTSRSAACTQCSDGKYTDLPAQTECVACPKGKYDAYGPGSRMAVVCQACEPGKIGPVEGMSDCINCERGKFVNVSGETECIDCFTGSYAANPGSSVCTLCAAGKTSLQVGQDSENNCTACEEGTYAERAGKTSCTDCAAGTNANTTGMVACTTCPSGTSSGIGQAECDICEPGTFSKPRAPACSNCEKGEYQPNQRASSCFLCEPGKFSSDVGFSDCVPCSAGTALNTTGGVECNDCGPGTFSPEGARACRRCYPGTYSVHSANPTCDNCPTGTFLNFFGATSLQNCTNCLPGTFANVTGTSACLLCPNGTSLSFFRAQSPDACQLCTAGKYAVEGASTCTDCPPATFSEKDGADHCLICGVGTYTKTGYSACRDCVFGTYNPEREQSSCRTCPLGEYCEQGSVYPIRCSCKNASTASQWPMSCFFRELTGDNSTADSLFTTVELVDIPVDDIDDVHKIYAAVAARLALKNFDVYDILIRDPSQTNGTRSDFDLLSCENVEYGEVDTCYYHPKCVGNYTENTCENGAERCILNNVVSDHGAS